MRNIYITYQPLDTRDITDQIAEQLSNSFLVTKDIELYAGVDPSKSLEYAIEKSDAFLLIIGSRWLEIIRPSHQEREERSKTGNWHDYRWQNIEAEVSSALSRNMPIVPVLIDDTTIPEKHSLPQKISFLADRLAFNINTKAELKPQLDRLNQLIQNLVEVNDNVPRVFISYAHDDEPSVLAVDQWLRDKGARVDIDKRIFIAGYTLRDEIFRSIKLAGKVICFYSSNSKDRPYTVLERDIAERIEVESSTPNLANKSIVIYFRIDDSPLPEKSSHKLAINAWKMDFEEACQELWRAIIEKTAKPKRVDLNEYKTRPPWSK